MKRKTGRILALFLTAVILAITVEAAETIWPTDLDDQNWNFEKAREWSNFAHINENSAELVIGLSKEKGDIYTRLSHLIAMNGGKIVKTISTKKEVLAIVAEIPFDSIPAFVDKVKTAGLAKYIEPNLRVRAESLPNDPYWSWQWGLRKIEADWAWNATLGDHSTLVAIIDSGIDYTHPDLAANYASGGKDWVNNDSDPMDDYGHGTRVSGIIAAEINNGIGIAGLAQVKIMAEKVFNGSGWGTVSWVAEGIVHATDQGAKIISMSLSTPYNGSQLYDPVKYAYDSDVLLVAAAGNYANDTKRYPAAYDEVIAVTSTNQNDQKAYSSNYGGWIELAAPGVNISTTVRGGGYDYGWSGTSYACPHVSGLAALIWSGFPNATRDWVRARLRETADDLGATGFDNYYGWGRINAKKAIYGTSPAINYTLTITTTAGGATIPIPGTYTYPQGEIVSAQAISNTGYTFDHWKLDGESVGSTNPYPVSMDKDHALHGVFVQINYTLTITATAGGTTSPEPGSYIYAAGLNISVTAIPNKNYVLDHWGLNGIDIEESNPISLTMDSNYTLYAVFRVGLHDLAITNVKPSKTVVGQGYSVPINVTVGNQGDYPETFDVTLGVGDWNENRTVYLPNGKSTTLTFTWNTSGFVKGNYTISACAWPVPEEINTTDNIFIDGWVIVAMIGDVTGVNGWPDGKVDIRDIALVARYYGQNVPPAPANCDLTGPVTGVPDGKIDIRDIATVAARFGKIDS